MKKLNILYLQRQPCIRPIKMAAGIKKKFSNIKLSFAYLKKSPSEFYGFGDKYFDDLVKLRNFNSKIWDSGRIDSQVVSNLRQLVLDNNYDLIHSHNWPDSLTVAALKTDTVPVIHDTHDTGTLGHRKLKLPKTILFEYLANIYSGGRITVTSGVMDYLNLQYNLPKENNLVFNNFVPKNIIPKHLSSKLSTKDNKIHLVYEGSISHVKGHHYNLSDIFKKIIENKPNLNIHIYVSKLNESSKFYENLSHRHSNLHFHGKVGSKSLLKELPQFDFGLALFNNGVNQPHLDTVLANKVLEYVASGLPVISFPDKTQKDFITKHKLGVIIDRDSQRNLYDIISDSKLDKIKENVLSKRFNFTVENNITKLCDFYYNVSNSHNKNALNMTSDLLEDNPFNLKHVSGAYP